MPSYDTSLSGPRTPFGKNEFRRSVKDEKTESYMVYAASVPAVTIDGFTGQKVLQPGTVMAKITSGPGAGMIGPFDRGAGGGVAPVNEQQSLTRTSTGGTITLGFEGEVTATIPATAAGFTAAAVQAALEALPNINVGDVAVTGAAGGPLTVVFSGQYAAQDVGLLVVDNTSATGGTIVAAEAVKGSAGGVGSGAATDGRQTPSNIVGLNETFLPWQLMERDVEVAVAYEASAVQAWCFEYANGVQIALTNGTRDAIVANVSTRLIRFS